MRGYLAIALGALTISGTTVSGQEPDEPKTWTIALSAGLSFTSGNNETSTFSGAYDLVFDSHGRNFVKSDALLLRGKTGGEVTTSRIGINVRDEYRLSTQSFVFVQNQYLRDEFKNIDYLLAPGVGIGVKLVDRMQTRLAVDAGVGSVWEKNPGAAVRSSGAVTANQKFAQEITSTTSLTQSLSVLWKTDNWDDSLYTLGLGVAVAMSARTQLKAEAIDVYQNLPPLPTIKRNDVTVLMAVVYKM